MTERTELGRQLQELRLRRENRVLHVQAHVNRHLIVAAAARVDLLAEVAKLLRQHPLDRHVHVLIVDANLKLAGRRELHDAS